MKNDRRTRQHPIRRARLRLVAVLSLCLLLLTGCWDVREVEHMFYIHTYAVDFRNGKYVVYFRILNPDTIAKTAGGGAGATDKTGSWTGKGEGATPLEAIHDIYATSQRRIYWGHTQTLIFSEEALKSKGIQLMLDIPTRYREFRHLPWIFCTNQPIPKLLTIQPILENSPVFSTQGDPTDMYGQTSFIAPVRLFHEIRNMLEPGRPSLIPELTIKERNWFDSKKSYPESEISGVGVLRNGRLIGRLSRDELVGSRWLTPDTKRTIIILRQKGKPVAALTLRHPKPSIHPTLNGTRLLFDVQVKVDSEYLAEQVSQMKELQLEAMAAKEIEHQIRQTFANGLRLKTDIYGLSDSLYRHNPRAFQRWVSAGGSSLLREDSLRHVNVKVTISNSGRTMEPTNHYSSKDPNSR